MGSSNKSRHALLNSLVSMSEAITFAHLSTVRDAAKPDVAERAAMADRLSRLVALHAVSPDQKRILTLTASDLQGAKFTEGGNVIEFNDGRAAIAGLCMMRAALNAAIRALGAGSMERDRDPGSADPR